MPLSPEENRRLAEIEEFLYRDEAPSPIRLDQVNPAAMALFGLDARIMADRATWLRELPPSKLSACDHPDDNEPFGSPGQ